MHAQFTTLRTADLMDALCDALDTVRASTAADNKPWMRALDRAWGYILEADTLEYNEMARAWRVESATRPGTFYVANGDCQCESFAHGGVCWHRAGARLIARALELRDLAAELQAEALAAGEVWYDAEIARVGARWRFADVMAVAAEWDEVTATARAAATGARIGRAQAAAMARAA